ncbi:MAG: 30S ribosomal protein S6 [Ignavibacteria bacterium]|nr:30S ribosomal protein S6 [Ignavibacteria bacterium]
MKKYYETYFILDGNLEDAQIEEIITKYVNFLKKNDAEIRNIEKIGRRRLAYQIKKSTNGYYICIEFYSDTSVLSKLERNYKLDEKIIRYLNIHMSKKELNEKDEFMTKKEKQLKEQKELEASKIQESNQPVIPTEKIAQVGNIEKKE